MKEQFVYRGHEVKVIDTWVDDDNRKKGVTIEPVGDYGFPIDVYLDDFKKKDSTKTNRRTQEMNEERYIYELSKLSNDELLCELFYNKEQMEKARIGASGIQKKNDYSRKEKRTILLV